MIGAQGCENVWVSNGSEAILVATPQLREATEEELWAPGLDELTLHENLMDLQTKLEEGEEMTGADETGPAPGTKTRHRWSRGPQLGAPKEVQGEAASEDDCR